jgi:hypothetical protein
MAEKLSSAQQKTIAFMRSKTIQDLGELGTQVGGLLAELTVELADAKMEAAHWKGAFDTITAEIKALVSVCIKRIGKGTRLVITKQEYAEIAKDGLTLFCDTEDRNVRMYELRRQEKQDKVGAAVNGIINGSAPH